MTRARLRYLVMLFVLGLTMSLAAFFLTLWVLPA